MILTPEMLTGKSRAHLIHLPTPHSPNHFLQAEAAKAFQGLQQSAVNNGFNLQPASSFRDFARQQLIWNGKFSGERKVHDDFVGLPCRGRAVIIGARKLIFSIPIYCRKGRRCNLSLGNMKKAVIFLN